MLLELRTLLVHDHAGAQPNACAQKGLRIAVWNETDVIGIRLLRGGKTVRGSLFTDLRLGGIADGEKAVLQLLGRNHAEHIRLILLLIQGAAHIAILVDGGVVARRNRIETECHALLQQRPELYLLVAAQAGIGRLAAGVGIHEVRDDLFFEFFRKVPDIKGNAQLIADAAGIGRILQ